jgi:dTDP-4-amino-4,6-dideoxygalactose transaminase
MQIPFTNLQEQHDSIKVELENYIREALNSFQFCKGREVNLFESDFSRLLNAKKCIATGNGTDSLFTVLKSLGIKQGDEVLTPAFSWISSSETISLCGATPVFVDVDPHYYTIDPSLIEKKITTKTKAVVVVHLYGQAAHIGEIRNICNAYNLFLIEDCAQAHLTAENGKCVGTFGDASAFSFYPTKNLGAYGDAGCIVTNNENLAIVLRRFANHGALEKDDHALEGMNSRMDTLQAAVLLAKLPHLKKWNEKRHAHAAQYTDLLKDNENIITPKQRPDTRHTFHIYAIRAKHRNELKQYLYEKGIQTLIHYPTALPNLQAYAYLNVDPQNFPVSTVLQDDVLSLPIFPELQPEAIRYICSCIGEFYRK